MKNPKYINELTEIFDNRYVIKSECNTNQESVNKRISIDSGRIDKLVYRIELWNKLLWTIASASIGALVLEFFGLIFK